jgi:hypothetical protein
MHASRRRRPGRHPPTIASKGACAGASPPLTGRAGPGVAWRELLGLGLRPAHHTGVLSLRRKRLPPARVSTWSLARTMGWVGPPHNAIRWCHVAQTTQERDISRRDAKAQRRREEEKKRRGEEEKEKSNALSDALSSFAPLRLCASFFLSSCCATLFVPRRNGFRQHFEAAPDGFRFALPIQTGKLAQSRGASGTCVRHAAALRP